MINNKILESETVKITEANKKVISIISHEIRGSFNSILAISSLILDESIKSKDELKELISLIHSTANKSSNLLDNLIRLTQIDFKQDPAENNLMNFESIVNEALDIHKFNINQKRLYIELNLQSKKKIKLEETVLSFIVRNLLSNAIKFSKNGDKIEIISLVRGNNIEFSVKDFGVGMTQKKIAEILNKTNYHSSKGTVGELGSGLGLNICQEYIQNYNGKLQIKSQKGKGCEVTVILPLKNS